MTLAEENARDSGETPSLKFSDWRSDDAGNLTRWVQLEDHAVPDTRMISRDDHVYGDESTTTG